MVNVGQIEKFGTNIFKAIERNCPINLSGKPIMSPIFRLEASAIEAIPENLLYSDVFNALRSLEGKPLKVVESILNKTNPSNRESFLTSLNNSLGANTNPKAISKKIEQLFGNNEDLIFKQANIGDCYLLTSLYSMWRNPTGKNILQNMIKNADDGYRVVFNAYPHNSITVKFSELDGQVFNGEKLNSVDGCDALKIIERAYGKLRKSLTRQSSNTSLKIVEGGHQQECLLDLFGNKAKPIRIASDTNISTTLKTNPDLIKKSEYLLEKFANNPEKYTLGAYTPTIPNNECYWYQFSRGDKKYARLIHNHHAYAIRDVNPIKRLINIVNPYDTSKVSEYTYDEFFQVFRGIKGVELS